MARKNPEPEGTRADIRSAAARLYTKNGVHAASLYDIAQEARMSKGTLYYHYPSKQKLTYEIADAHFSFITEVIYAWSDELTNAVSPIEALEPLSETLLQEHAWVRLHFALISEAMRVGGELKQLVADKQREWAMALELASLKMSGPGVKRFHQHCGEYVPLLFGCAMHMLAEEQTVFDTAFLNRLLCE
jgi:AcrR family transcriptional regulator